MLDFFFATLAGSTLFVVVLLAGVVVWDVAAIFLTKR